MVSCPSSDRQTEIAETMPTVCLVLKNFNASDIVTLVWYGILDLYLTLIELYNILDMLWVY